MSYRNLMREMREIAAYTRNTLRFSQGEKAALGSQPRSGRKR